MKNIFWCGCCSLSIFVAKKATKGTRLQFLCTQDIIQGGKIDYQRLMFTCTYRNHEFKQYSTCIKLITHFLITVHILHAPGICWQP